MLVGQVGRSGRGYVNKSRTVSEWVSESVSQSVSHQGRYRAAWAAKNWFKGSFLEKIIVWTHNDPTNIPNCYTWLESYGSPLKENKYLSNPRSCQNFCNASAENCITDHGVCPNIKWHLNSNQTEFSPPGVKPPPTEASTYSHHQGISTSTGADLVCTAD